MLMLALPPVCPDNLQHILVAVFATSHVAVTLLGSVHKRQSQTVLQNDECCSSCNSKKDSDKLLCCELCPRVYHLYCLKPSLKAIPSGDWFCIHCQQILCLEDVEKFLAFRTRLVVCSSIGDIDQSTPNIALQKHMMPSYWSVADSKMCSCHISLLQPLL